jgi:tetraacyldisaccharide 4'-kinase
MHPSEVWYGQSLGARLARAALTPVSWLYAGGWLAYRSAYDLGLKRPTEPHRAVICVGNLLVGGSGKTPVTLHIAEVLRDMGRQIVISASGYGGPRTEAASLAPDGPLKASEWGDEPAMIRWLLPDVPLIVGRRRVLAAEICAKEHPRAVMLMDDGFQHLPLRKHVSILLDPLAPRNSMCLPAGPYREPRSGRSRADLILPDRFRVDSGPTGLIRHDGAAVPMDEAPDRSILLLAVGDPERIERSLRESGLHPVTVRLLPDHDPMTAGNLFQFLPTDLPVITTAKDWVKLRERPDVGEREWLIAEYEARIEPAAEFRAWLEARLDGFPTTETQAAPE